MRKSLLTIACFGSVFLFSASLAAQSVYDWPSEEVPVAVQDGGSLFFLGKDKTVWRVYSWRAPSGDHKASAFFTDIDDDSKPEVVGAGKPTFALDHDSNPIWSYGAGCDQVLVGDFALDSKLDVVCVKGQKIEARAWDWQLIWSISLGKRWDWCRAGDVNGDLKLDLECKIRGSKNYSRVDGSSGEMLAASTETAEVTSPNDPNIEPVSDSILKGEEQFDVDGDGTAEESLVVDGNAVAIKSRSKKIALGRIELGAAPVAAIVKDLDGDGKPEVVVVSKSQIAVWSHGDEKPALFPLSTKSYKREPVARLQSVYANGFEDDAAAQKVVEDLNDKLANCYSSQVRKNQFAGVGRALVEVKVGDGKVKKVEKHHSSLADDKVVDCARNVLKGGKYPAGENGSVNVTLQYTFRDR